MNEMEKRSPINIKHVDDFFVDYLGRPKELSALGETKEQLTNRILTKDFLPATKKQKRHLYKTLVTYRSRVSEECKPLLDKLIGNRRLVEKACIIADGSFAKFRIWPTMYDGKICIYISTHKCDDDRLVSLCERKEYSKALNHIIGAYDMIPFHDIDIDLLEWQEEMHDMEPDFDY